MYVDCVGQRGRGCYAHVTQLPKKYFKCLWVQLTNAYQGSEKEKNNHLIPREYLFHVKLSCYINIICTTNHTQELPSRTFTNGRWAITKSTIVDTPLVHLRVILPDSDGPALALLPFGGFGWV